MIFKEYLEEGLEFNKSLNSFEFNFKDDNEECLIKLSKEIKEIKEYEPCTFFGYCFEDNIKRDLKVKTIDFLKYSNDENIKILINKSIMSLNNIVNLSKFKTIVYPESSSKLNNLIVDKISDISLGKLTPFKLVKELPKNIEFDFERYVSHLRKNNVIAKDIENSCNSVKIMMKQIHDLEYFKIGKNSKVKYRNFLKNFYKFETKEQENTFKELQNEKILIIDDISTTHSTIKYILNTIRTINSKCEIVVFCLIGNKK